MPAFSIAPDFSGSVRPRPPLKKTLVASAAGNWPTQYGQSALGQGGIFVALSIGWGWWIDGVRPDRYDIAGGLIALLGVAIIMYAPRN